MGRKAKGITVVICGENLGRPALLVSTADKPLLFLNEQLSCDERIAIMAGILNLDAV